MADLKLQSERRKLQLKANILHERARIASSRDALNKNRQELAGLQGRKPGSSASASSTGLRKVSLFSRKG